MDGKAMVVCMSRRICVELYRELVRLRPDWHHEADEGGGLKVVMTGSATDPADWQPHIRTKSRREALAHRFRDACENALALGRLRLRKKCVQWRWIRVEARGEAARTPFQRGRPVASTRNFN